MRLALRTARFSHTAALVTALVLGCATSASAGALSAWLAVEDPVERCPALVVLNGDHPARATEAARLYHAAVGQQIWLTSDPRSGDGVGADAGTRSNAVHVVVRGGVPAAAVHRLPGDARGTRAELQIIAAELRRRELPCVVLVTSPLHARRVKVTWRRVVGMAPRAVVRHATGAAYTGWRIEAQELALTFLAWIGLPR